MGRSDLKKKIVEDFIYNLKWIQRFCCQEHNVKALSCRWEHGCNAWRQNAKSSRRLKEKLRTTRTKKATKKKEREKRTKTARSQDSQNDNCPSRRVEGKWFGRTATLSMFVPAVRVSSYTFFRGRKQESGMLMRLQEGIHL